MFAIENTLLILIDIQGKLASLMHGKDHLYKNFEIIVKSMNILKIPIIWMEQVPDKLGPTIQQITNHLPDLEPIPKYTFSCCGNDEFMEKLKSIERKQILLTGIETHICVYQTACDLIKKGYEVQVIDDCVSSRTQSNKTIGLKRIKEAGGSVTSTETILFELMKSTKAEGFREITKLIK
ncbi:MAG: hydrolase [Desulfobacteraceae bacterium]|nr:hydrolase [Desulfobacteraceae bacterium]